MTRLSSLLQWLRHEASYPRYRTLTSRLVPVSSDAYATHLPILIGVAALLTPRRILELGSGRFSTVAFCDPELFPTVEHVHTMEDDANWAELVKAMPIDRDRISFELVPSIRGRLSEIDLEPYDLIFVDNAMSVTERAATLRVVLALAPANAVVVVHDFEWRAYRAEVAATWREYTFAVWRPLSGVIWKGDQLTKSALGALEKIMRKNREESPAATRYWREHIAHLNPANKQS